MLAKNFVLLQLAALIGLSGCTRRNPEPPRPAAAEPAMKPAPPTPIAQQREELGGKTWNPQWDAVVEQALPPEMLSPQAARAVRSFCPNFAHESEADKRAFWAYLFQALAAAEAGLNPTADVHHTQPAMLQTDEVTKRPIRQQGLLQLSYQDARRYGCDLDWAADKTKPVRDPERSILQPEKNLQCGVKIMQNQIITQAKPLVSRTSYWSTLQPGTASYRVFSKQMANTPAACRLPKGRHSR